CHTDWLNMIYPRLVIAKNHLTDDGVIFISIDDGEQENLKKVCNEIFGEQNFLAQIIWERAYSPINLKKNFSENHDYIIAFAKNIKNVETDGIPGSSEQDSLYINPDHDERGPWKSSDFSVGPAVEKNIYEIKTPCRRIITPPSACSLLYSKTGYKEFLAVNSLCYGVDWYITRKDTKSYLKITVCGLEEMGIVHHHIKGFYQKLNKE